MNIGDLVRITYTTAWEKHNYDDEKTRIAMIIEGPNEVGKIKLLLSNGASLWKHCTEVEYMPKDSGYLKE